MITVSITHVIILSCLLRICFFLFGLYQDAYMTVKYTDIDYLVFSDAAKYVYNGQSPYSRETYRYTPLLAWLLVPNSWGGLWYNFGKCIFMVCDLVTGFIILTLLQDIRDLGKRKMIVLSSIWLLNPMVITISTRGSSESVLTVLIMLSLYYFAKKSFTFSAFWLGLSIHFKIYPIIYFPSMLLYLSNYGKPIINKPIIRWVNTTNIKFLLTTLITLSLLNGFMYYNYGYEFLFHTYLYHLTRVDHRHNFSVYNISLYYKSAFSGTNNIEKIAFLPQFLISFIIFPLVFARENLISCLFLQTFAFVIFNKVITSQYFIWFLIFLPHFLTRSHLASKKHIIKGLTVLILWLLAQGMWLYFAYRLEFLGISTFDNGLLYSSIFFFLVNCWILGVFIEDLGDTLK